MTAPHTGTVMAVTFIHWVTADLWTREMASLFTGTDEATGPQCVPYPHNYKVALGE